MCKYLEIEKKIKKWEFRNEVTQTCSIIIASFPLYHQNGFQASKITYKLI